MTLLSIVYHLSQINFTVNGQLNDWFLPLILLKIKPQNLIDWGSESAVDPINPLVYIQAIVTFCKP